MAKVLFVSKPVAPPWNDSSKNLAWDLARSLRRHDPILMSRTGVELSLARGRLDAVYGPSASSFSAGLAQNARVLGRLLLGARGDLWHFFFAPNPRTSTIGRTAARFRSVPTVHTVCSSPALGADLAKVLFSDRTVVLSTRTERQMLDAGVDAARLVRIPPCIEPLAEPSDEERSAARVEFGLPRDAFLVVFPGDLEFGDGAKHLIEAFARLSSHAVLAMACRRKTDRSEGKGAELKELIARLGLSRRVFWIGETARIHSLLGAADVVALPTETLYAKMDYPLVLLEAMSRGRLVLVAQGTSAEELCANGAAWACEPRAEAIAHALTEAEDVEKRRAVGRRAREAVLGRFSRAAMAEAYEALYDALLGSSS